MTAREPILSPNLVPIVEPIPYSDPAGVFQRLAGLPYTSFFDSASSHPELGRFCFLTADPFEWIWARGNEVQVSSEPRPRKGADPLVVLQERLALFPSWPVPGLPPFQGGAAGLFAYELCHHLERLPWPEVDEFHLPDLALGLYDWVIAWDNPAQRAWLISTGFPEMDPGARQSRARRRVDQVKVWLEAPPRGGDWRKVSRLELHRQQPVPGFSHITSNFTRTSYLEAVAQALEYIRAGDCFQVNLAQRLISPANAPPVELYCRLRERNAAPFAAYVDLGSFVIVSASPERFLCIRQGHVETRPIKGTRPRGSTLEEDRAQAAALLQSEKDRAENIMIVDLLRNDLGRVCRYGSIRVPALCRLETYRFVHHLVSEVRGQLREGVGPVDLIRAGFPGGSVTGAPKIRAMEIITGLERTARGAYCGSVGYLGFDGSMDTNILIRSFTLGGGWLQFPVGGGIVADSVPEREYEETWHKAEGLLRGLD